MNKFNPQKKAGTPSLIPNRNQKAPKADLQLAQLLLKTPVRTDFWAINIPLKVLQQIARAIGVCLAKVQHFRASIHITLEGPFLKIRNFIRAIEMQKALVV